MTPAVSIFGPALAGLISSCQSSGSVQDCDGLLFGVISHRPREVYTDEQQGPQTVQSTEVLISSSVCCTSTCSFYNTAGDIDSTRLAALIPPGVSLLGWFSFRAGMGSTLQPSMRELAVTRNLAAHMPSAPRADSLPLLLKVSTSLDHNNGTLTTNYRAYGQGTSLSSASEHVARRLVPIPLTHDNLAKGTNHSQYHSFLPVSTSHMLGGKVHMEELSAPVAVVQQALKGLVDGQLGELAALCQEATVREQKLAQLRLEHSQLAQKAYEKTVGNK